jgi:FMN phosphatase YigB (HAD superfamily)
LLHDYVPNAADVRIDEFFDDPRGVHGPDGTHERPSRLRFQAALERVGCPADRIEEGAIVLSRAHMATIAEATVLPLAHGAVLDAARSFARVGIVTNFDDTAGGYALLERHGLLERVDTVVISEAVARRKPHPLPVVAALRSLEVPAAEALMIGDSARADVGAAHAAGVDAVLIDPSGESSATLPPGTIVVRSLAEVPRRLEW